MMVLSLPHVRTPEYREGQILEYRGNPLIEALPPIDDDATVLKKLRQFPRIPENELQLPAHLRKHLTGRIRELVVPLPEFLTTYRMVEDAILRSYGKKNPFSPTTMHFLHYLDSDETPVQPITGRFRPEGLAMTLQGDSGVGKSHMVKRVLSMYPQCIQHRMYAGRELCLPQLTWIYVECPEDGSLVSFCRAILTEIDILAGTDLVEESVKKRSSKDALQRTIERMARNLFVGIIVVDEISKLELPKNGHDHPLLSFLLTLINQSGVPFLFIGNPDLENVFTKTLRVARRAENGGYIKMLPLAPETWDIFARRLWSMQWTMPQTPFDDALCAHLRQLSFSTPDLAARTFQEAQKSVIGTGDERITIGALNEGQRRALALSKKTIYTGSEPSSPNVVAQEASSVLSDETSTSETEATSLGPTAAAGKGNQSDIADLDRPQHPEFKERLLALMGQSPLPLGIHEPSLLRDGGDAIDLMDYFVTHGLVPKDVLQAAATSR